MESTYPIYYQGQIAGTAELAKEGLYWRISCRCQLPIMGKHTVKIQQEVSLINLGLCVPYENGFGLKTRISAKKIGPGSIRFLLCKEEKGQFIPLTIPFAYIKIIPKGTLRFENGQYGVYISEASAKPDSDQSQTPHC